MIWFALALLVAGALVGSRGLRGLGRLVRGPWRPGAGVFGGLCAFAALALAARAQWAAAVVLLVVAAVLIYAARARPAARDARPPEAASLGRREAESLLGLGPDPAPTQVEEAYRRLMRRAHPDAGGTAGLAAQLNAARATLLRRAVT